MRQNTHGSNRPILSSMLFFLRGVLGLRLENQSFYWNKIVTKCKKQKFLYQFCYNMILVCMILF